VIELVDAGQERIAELLPTADIFCGHAKVPVPWDEVVAGGRLQWIQSSAAGMDHCLVPSVIASDIIVTSASGLFADQVAEQTLALLLGLLRGLPTFFRQQQRKDFTRQPTGDLHGKTVGIIGFGGNGRRIAEVLSAFKVRLLATDLFPIRKPDHVDQLLAANRLDDVLRQSDVVILCVPLNAHTEGMIDAAAISAIKPGSILINVARGPVVVEAELVDALRCGHLQAAGLDVTEIEPLPSESSLWELPNVIITPHVGAQSARRVDDSTDFFCRNLARYLRGEPLANLVDKELGFPRPSSD
jgi:D-3-phosphoglycerate dehydrogenase